MCDWKTREENGQTFVCLEERYFGRRGDVLSLSQLAGAERGSGAYESLGHWIPQDEYAQLWEETQPVAQRMLASGRIGDAWSAFQLLVTTAPDQIFPKQVEELYRAIAPTLSDCSLWACAIDPKLQSRLAGARALFASSEATELFDRDSFDGFQAARGLFSDLVTGMGSYINPALLALSPYVIGCMGYRIGGMVIVLFGKPIFGLESVQGPELLQLFAPTRYMSGVSEDALPEPEIPPDVLARFLGWWIERLNDLFSQALDVSSFQDSHGDYDSPRHFGFLLSLEKLFACVQGTLAYTGRNEFIRKLLFFDALDIMEGFRQGPYQKLLKRKHLMDVVDTLKEHTPPEVQAVLLPRFENAVTSLDVVAAGFYLHERISPEGMTVPTKSGRLEVIGMDSALAEYVRLVRNSAHSFSQVVGNPRNVALLASHTGELPPEIADLGFLHLVHMLVKPEILFRQ
jgi:hypothetical protein